MRENNRFNQSYIYVVMLKGKMKKRKCQRAISWSILQGGNSAPEDEVYP